MDEIQLLTNMNYQLALISNSNIENYKIVIATPNTPEKFYKKSPAALFLEKSGWDKRATVVFENKKGLPALYNSFINEENINKRIIFMHDDLLIQDLFFNEKIELAFAKYDIVGLAGAKTCNLQAPTKAWHLMTDRENMVGEVGHSKDKKSWTTVFGPSDSRSLIIDGLFIAVDVNKLLQTQTYFDENFDFHHYDITFCLRANQNKLKIGVYPIQVLHFGLGDSMISTEWHKSALKFKEKYC